MMVKIETEGLIRTQVGMTLDLLRASSNPYSLRSRLLAAVDEYDKELLVGNDSALAYLKSNLRGIIEDIIDDVTEDDSALEMITTTDASNDADDIDKLIDLDAPILSGMIRVSVLIERLEILQEKLDAIPKFSHVSLGSCECGGKMVADYDNGCHSCGSCGATQSSVVSMYVEDRGMAEASSKPKSNSYKTHKHFDKWMNRILAIDPPKDGNDIIPTILRYVREKNIARDMIDGEAIRRCLKILGLNKYYVYTAWFLKEVTGHGPPQLTEEESRDIAYRFGVISDTFDKIRNRAEKKTGRIYYPFFIYKIIATKFANRPDKVKILNYIHVQEEKTQSKNNGIYSRILKDAKNPRLTAKD